MPRRGPFDGSDWPADPVGTSHRTARRCTTAERTTRRRREEIKGGPLGGSPGSGRVSKRGMQEVEEPSGRTTGGQPRPLRAWSVFYPSGAPCGRFNAKPWNLAFACRNHFCPTLPMLLGLLFAIAGFQVILFRNFHRNRYSTASPSFPARDFNERYSVSGSSTFIRSLHVRVIIIYKRSLKR